MALKEKNPTPTNIVEQIQKQNPQGPPSNPQKEQTKGSTTYTPEEIQQIQNLQKEMNNVIFNLGQLKVSEIRIESSKISLESNFPAFAKRYNFKVTLSLA